MQTPAPPRRSSPSPRRSSLSRPLTGVALLGVLALTACSGSQPAATQDSPQDVMAAAKKALDATSGVQLALATSDLPDGVDGVEKASGVANHQPAFDGKITVIALGGASLDIPVIAVDDTVYADIPLLIGGYRPVDPDKYGAPDPAQLMDPDDGISSLLVETDGLKKGDTVRGGKDNKETLTEYSGTVAADDVTHVIPSASGDAFDATYQIDGDGQVREARLTGQFYPDTDESTYTISLDDYYGTEKDIKAP